MDAGRASGLGCCSAARDRGRAEWRRGERALGATAGKSRWLWAAGAAPACWQRGGRADGSDNMHAQGCLRSQAVLMMGWDGNARADGRVAARWAARQVSLRPMQGLQSASALPSYCPPLPAMRCCL